jgi:AbrB family looped-hinge helix DNA binding protein
MKSTIDSAGRIVIPRDIRAGAGLLPGAELEIRLRDGIVEIEPAATSVRMVKKGRLRVAEPAERVETLAEDVVSGVRRRVRNDE